MVGTINRLNEFIRVWFTWKIVCFEIPQASTQDTTRKKTSRRYHTVVPSERFVWAIIAVIIALVGLIVLEALLPKMIPKFCGGLRQ